MANNENTHPAKNSTELTSEQKFEIFKYYEEASEKTKAHAWSQTTWILTLNAGVLAFSVNFYAKYCEVPGFLIIELITSAVGMVLSGFLIYLLIQLGTHIKNYWTASNKLAAEYTPLRPFIGETVAMEAGMPGYKAEFPRFCVRLHQLATLFIAAHAGWAAIMVALAYTA